MPIRLSWGRTLNSSISYYDGTSYPIANFLIVGVDFRSFCNVAQSNAIKDFSGCFFYSFFFWGVGWVKPKTESCKFEKSHSRTVSAYVSSLSFLDNRASQLKPHPPPFLSIRLHYIFHFQILAGVKKFFAASYPIVEPNELKLGHV